MGDLAKLITFFISYTCMYLKIVFYLSLPLAFSSLLFSTKDLNSLKVLEVSIFQIFNCQEFFSSFPES